MDMLEIHAEASESSIVAYNDFLLHYQRGGMIVYAFVEGRDDPSFYRGFIESVLIGGWECRMIRAEGKKKVIEVFDEMDWSRFPSKAVCFFVDRDLSSFVGGEAQKGSNLYVSDNYSIENDVVNVHVFQRFLEEVNGVCCLRPEEMNRLREMFESNLSYFKESLACVMAQIVALRRNEANGDVPVARLDKIKPHGFFDYIDGELKLSPHFFLTMNRVQHSAMALGTTVPTEEQLNEWEQEFRAGNGVNQFVRGKYLLRFFVDCVESLRAAIPRLFSRFEKAPGSCGGIGAGNAMILIAPRARCPASLREFLDENYVAFMKQGNDA